MAGDPGYGAARTGLGRLYRLARYRVRPAPGAEWLPVRRLPGGPWAVVTGWNPGSRRHPAALNRRRDRELAGWLDRRAVPRLPAVGASPDGRWREDGWCIPHRAPRTAVLLRIFRQRAAWVVAGGRGRVVWSGPA